MSILRRTKPNSTTGVSVRNWVGQRIGKSKRIFPLLLLFPAVLMIGMFVLYPVIYGLWLSFQSWNGLSPATWIGLGNYERAFSDPIFWESLGHNVEYVITSVVAKMIIGLGLAILVNRKIRGIGAYRTILFIPVMLSFVAVALLWSWIYNPVFGLLDDLLQVFGIGKISWLGSSSLALWAIIAVDVWKWAGYHMVLFLAGLQGISPQLYEAAAVDGATRTRAFLRITLPLLVPVLVINLVLAVQGGFNVFELPFIMTKGGPFYASSVVSVYSYIQAFQFYQFSYGDAMAYILLVIVIIVTGLQLRVMRRLNN